MPKKKGVINGLTDLALGMQTRVFTQMVLLNPFFSRFSSKQSTLVYTSLRFSANNIGLQSFN